MDKTVVIGETSVIKAKATVKKNVQLGACVVLEEKLENLDGTVVAGNEEDNESEDSD